jgi:ABC-2 type transport system permease protein
VNGVYRVNAARGVVRAFLGARGRARIPALAGLFSLLLFVALEVVGLEAALRTSSAALAYLPEIRPAFLVERLLGGALAAAAGLVLLGSLTTAVSTLFLSDELAVLAVLPFPHRRLLARQSALTLALASTPSLLLALPALGVAAAASRAPLLAACAGGLALSGLFLLAGSAGIAGALGLVRVVPARRARLFAALLSALGLSAALVGFRVARPERLLDPVEALGLLQKLGAAPPPAPSLSPAAWAARGTTLALEGHAAGLLPCAILFALGLAACAVLPAALSGAHRTVWRDMREGSSGDARSVRRRSIPKVRSLFGLLVRAEAATVLRDASTPAQVGSLAAVFVLDLLNLGLLPAAEPAARDLVAGLQAGLALFLVSALSLRFAYPAVSTDGRAAAVLRSLPLDPGLHLAARWAARAAPAVLASLVLTGVSLAVLKPSASTSAAALAAAAAGGLAIPALHTGLGALFPRYADPNPIAVALGAGGLLALVLSTALSLVATVAVSGELRALLEALVHVRAGPWAVLASFLFAAAAAAAIPMILARRALTGSDVSVG